jgi:hypothetical protein
MYHSKTPMKHSMTVMTPSGATIKPLFSATLSDERIPQAARVAHIFEDNDLPKFNLISVPALANAGMKVSFSHDNAVVEDETGKGIIWANRDKDTGLYFLKPPTNVLAVMYPQHGAHSERTAFYIECMGSPTTSCLINAVERGWVNLPGLTPKLLRNHPHSIATNKGHLDKTKSGLDTTHPTTVTNHKNSAHLLVTCEQKTIFADLTGRFPHVSARGVEYIMCTRCSDTNYIHVEPLRSRNAKDFSAAFERSVNFFKERGIEHTKAKMDNETSNLFRETVRRLNIKVEYVPPDNHRQSPIERDIRTFKDHFIASLCTTDPDFPLSEWDLLLPQAEMTLMAHTALREIRLLPLVPKSSSMKAQRSDPRGPLMD